MNDFFEAVIDGNYDSVKFMMDVGVSANDKDSEGKTYLIHAIENDHVSIARILIDYGSNPEIGMTKTGETPLMAATRVKKWRLARALLEDGAMVNTRDFEGDTALIKAVMVKDYKMVKLLIGWNADVSLTNHKGETALSVAISRNCKNKILKCLKENGAVVGEE